MQMTEVLNNILNTACDAVSLATGKIVIEGVLQNGSVLISITDNGAGITTDNLAHVFDPFFTTKAKGTGLGLSVCQQIINLHQGSIKLESAEGKGTTVTIILPMKRLGDRANI